MTGRSADVVSVRACRRFPAVWERVCAFFRLTRVEAEALVWHHGSEGVAIARGRETLNAGGLVGWPRSGHCNLQREFCVDSYKPDLSRKGFPCST